MSATAMATPAKPTTGVHPRLQYAGVVGRWALGALFVYLGSTKALHPEAFLKLLRQYELTNSWFLLNSIAAGLPWFEVFCGLLLLAGVAVRGTALLLLAMLIPFTVVVLHRALAIAGLAHIAFCAVRFDCGCGSGEVLICRKLAENVLLILATCGLIIGLGRPLAARFSLLGQDKP